MCVISFCSVVSCRVCMVDFGACCMCVISFFDEGGRHGIARCRVAVVGFGACCMCVISFYGIYGIYRLYRLYSISGGSANWCVVYLCTYVRVSYI